MPPISGSQWGRTLDKAKRRSGHTLVNPPLPVCLPFPRRLRHNTSWDLESMIGRDLQYRFISLEVNLGRASDQIFCTEKIVALVFYLYVVLKAKFDWICELATLLIPSELSWCLTFRHRFWQICVQKINFFSVRSISMNTFSPICFNFATCWKIKTQWRIKNAFFCVRALSFFL